MSTTGAELEYDVSSFHRRDAACFILTLSRPQLRSRYHHPSFQLARFRFLVYPL